MTVDIHPAAELLANGGYGCIVIPRELFGEDERRFTEAIVRSVERLEPATTPLRRAVYRTLARLADAKVRITPQAFVLGLLLAAAKINGDKVETHPRDLAKEVGVRYSTLLKVRKAAMAEMALV